jgi:prolyl oligopeptidase PreP (S9A serine peptidase family)
VEDQSHILENGTTNANHIPNGQTPKHNSKLTHEWIGLPDAEELDLPVGCSIYSLTCRDDDSRIFFHVIGYTLAGRIYQYTFHSRQTTPRASSNGTAPKRYGDLSTWRESRVDEFEPERWAVEQHWIPNPNDGVMIPMYLIKDKSLAKNGDAFCLLYGYSLLSSAVDVDTGDSIYL